MTVLHERSPLIRPWGEGARLRRGVMRRVLVLLAAAVMLGSPLETLTASRGSRSAMHQLKKRHKEQKKALKQQQHAMKKVMNQHELSSDVTERFNHDLKMQRQLLRKDQKDETQNLKNRDAFVRRPHPSS